MNKVLLGLAIFGAASALGLFTRARLNRVDFDFGRLKVDFSKWFTGSLPAKLPVKVKSKVGVAAKFEFTGFLYLDPPNGLPIALLPIIIQPFTIPANGERDIELNLQITISAVMSLISQAIQQGKNPSQLLENRIYVEGIYTLEGVRLPIKQTLTLTNR